MNAHIDEPCRSCKNREIYVDYGMPQDRKAGFVRTDKPAEVHRYHEDVCRQMTEKEGGAK